jgi:DNA (cytosine-5)-methyltransferase 1
MKAYYNEIDPFASQWLRNLIEAGLIANGDVDERSIKDVSADDIAGYTQCHFFAGIGVWSYALRLARWPDDRPVWTGSCPCQPFSTAGKQKGVDDDRHLWPEWSRLIKKRKPPVVFGEQVEAAIRHGWLDLVSADLESCDYSFGAAVLPAAGVHAPHIRSRAWFVADSGLANATGHRLQRGSEKTPDEIREKGQNEIGIISLRSEGCIFPDLRGASGMGCSGMADSNDTGSQRGVFRREDQEREVKHGLSGRDGAAGWPHADGSFWSDCDWICCRDGKRRPVEPGSFPLAYGATQRVGRLCAYGNAIEAHTAATFIRAFMLTREQ